MPQCTNDPAREFYEVQKLVSEAALTGWMFLFFSETIFRFVN